MIPTNKTNTETIESFGDIVEPDLDTAYQRFNNIQEYYETFFWSEIDSDFIQITVNYPTVLTPFGKDGFSLSSDQYDAVVKWFRVVYRDSFPADVNEAHIRVLTKKGRKIDPED